MILLSPCNLLKFFNQNPWIKSGSGDFQLGILPKIFYYKFVFNIYVLAVVITVISYVRRIIRLTEYSRFCISNTFLSILVVPNKAVFCITPTLHVRPSFLIHLLNSAETLLRAPFTAGTISTYLNFHNLLISFFISWYCSTFSFFFSTLTSAGTVISIIIPFCSFLSITIRSGRLASIRLSHWIFMSHSTLISSFSTALWRAFSYHFSLCSNPFFFYKFPNELSLQHCCVVFCILFEPIFNIRLLSVAHLHLFSHTIYTGVSLVLVIWYLI